MPPLSRWYVRSALIHWGLGTTLGALLLAHKGVPWADWLWRLLPAHQEFLLVGWVVQIGLGMALWIAPRYWGEARQQTGGRGLWALVALNAGVWLTAVGPLTPVAWLTLGGRLLETAAVILGLSVLWPRILGRNAPLRQA